MRVLNKYSECNNTIGNYPALYHNIPICYGSSLIILRIENDTAKWRYVL